MKLALSEISTPGASFAEDVEAYAAAGFDGYLDIEIFSTPDALWGLPVGEAAARAAAAGRSLMAQS